MEENQVTTDQNSREQDFPSTDSSSLELAHTQESVAQEHRSGDQPTVEASVSSLGVEQNIQALLAEMESLRRDFEAKVKYDTSKERTIESLHRELQVYREGLHFRVLRPAFIDLIALYDDMGKLIERMGSDASFVSDQMMLVIQHLKVLQETIEEILRRNGVEPFTAEDEVFLPSKQRSLKMISTCDPALDKYIARRIRQGFAYEDKVLRHELVEVYRYMPTSE